MNLVSFKKNIYIRFLNSWLWFNLYYRHTKQYKNEFKWLIVPIEMEFELSKSREEGGSFAFMEELDIDEINKMY